MSEVLNEAVNTTMEVIEKAPKPKGDWKKYAVGFAFGVACAVTADYISKKRKAKNHKPSRKSEVEEVEVEETESEEVEETKEDKSQTKKTEKK